MLCYECKSKVVRREAVGICHRCGVALCEEHAHVDSIPIVATYGDEAFPSITGTVELPRKGRLALCPVCHEALTQQKEQAKAKTVPPAHREARADQAA
jgi:hypothetical protein